MVATIVGAGLPDSVGMRYCRVDIRRIVWMVDYDILTANSWCVIDLLGLDIWVRQLLRSRLLHWPRRDPYCLCYWWMGILFLQNNFPDPVDGNMVGVN